MKGAARCILMCCAVLATSRSVAAQSFIGGDAPRRGSIELSGGATLAPGFDMGSLTAELTRSTPAERFEQFTSDSAFSSYSKIKTFVYLVS